MILLQAGAGGGMFQILFLVGMIAIFYFFMIRPQQKKQNDQKKMIDELKEGDEVVTIGGMHGKVLSKDENTVTLSAGGGARLTFEKSSIARKK
ncbi:MAG: preprotein translocase subunit YajC [Spirosomataceae bacterium]